MTESHIDPADLRGPVAMTNEQYHAAPGVSSSHIKDFRRNAFYYACKYVWKTLPEEEKSRDHFDVGSALHTLLIEPDLFRSQYVAYDGTRRGRDWEAFESENSAFTILRKQDMDLVEGMARAVNAHPVASRLFNGGIGEQSYFAEDPHTGLLIKARPDYLRPDMMVDIKTTTDASPEGFRRAVTNFDYHVSDVYYRRVLSALYGEAPPMTWLAIEKDPPYLIGVYFASPDAVQKAELIVDNGLHGIAQCYRKNHWPDWATEARPIDLMPWANTTVASIDL